MSVKVFVFDLDDTLYNELDFVKSGFRAVSEFLSRTFKIDEEAVYEKMVQILFEEGRGAVFNSVLHYYNCFTIKCLKKCISVYRMHKPNIKLLPESTEVLQKLKGKPVYIVTDGNKNVQYNKISALGLDDIVTKFYITYRYGRVHSKPSPYCFEKIAQIEQVQFSEMVYIGDNPNKDFVGIKPLGVRTIQIRKGMFQNIILPEEYQAEEKIDNLLQIFEVINRWEEK